jgi:aminoglycoside phosphotransferase (APT) family kinase protein
MDTLNPQEDFARRCAAVLSALGVPDAARLGGGGEGTVFALSADEAVKIYRAGDNAPYLAALADLHATLARHALPFATPRITEISYLAGTDYTIERRLPGRSWDKIAAPLTPDERHRALDSFLDALPTLHTIELPNHPYGQALHLADRLTAPTWPAFLRASAERRLARAAEHLRRDVPGLDQRLPRFFSALAALPAAPPKTLVHGDYFLGNVLFDERGRLAAVLDFSPHTVVGDPLLDVAGAVSFLSLSPHITPAETEHVRARATARYGDIGQPLALYTLYYSVYFSTWQSDPISYAWCIANLRDAALWARAVGIS